MHREATITIIVNRKKCELDIRRILYLQIITFYMHIFKS